MSPCPSHGPHSAWKQGRGSCPHAAKPDLGACQPQRQQEPPLTVAFLLQERDTCYHPGDT